VATRDPRGFPEGTLAEATQLGADVVGCGFLIELAFLAGREKLAPRDVHALLRYEA